MHSPHNPHSFNDKVAFIGDLLQNDLTEEATNFFARNLRPDLTWIASQFIRDKFQTQEGRTFTFDQSEKFAIAAISDCPELERQVDEYSVMKLAKKLERQRKKEALYVLRSTRLELKKFAAQALVPFMGEKLPTREVGGYEESSGADDAPDDFFGGPKSSTNFLGHSFFDGPLVKVMTQETFLKTLFVEAKASTEELELLYAHDVLGFTITELAQAQNTPVSTLTSRLDRFKKRLFKVALKTMGFCP